MTVISLFLALLIGMSLGLIGGGGSILTVPVLVYAAGISPTLATAYSLFIVGGTSLVGALNNVRLKLVHIPTALIFSVPSLIAVYSVRKWFVPLIPKMIFSIGSLEVTKNIFIMVFFAAIMFFAALSMIRHNHTEEKGGGAVSAIRFNYPLIIAEGLVVGALTGLVGAGGGFLIIPALVMFAKLPMRLAIGTSLLIIAIKSLIGFIGDAQNTPNMDWTLLLSFTAIASGGIFIGAYLSKFLNAASLKKVFGWFVLVMSVYILIKELVFPTGSPSH